MGGSSDCVGGLVEGCRGGVGASESPTSRVGLSWGSSGWARWGCVGGWSGRDGWASTGGPQGGELVLPGPVGGVVQDSTPGVVGDAGWHHDQALADGGHAGGVHARGVGCGPGDVEGEDGQLQPGGVGGELA